MALIIEIGNGGSDSESYIGVADADIYHSNRGNASWAGLTDAVKEQNLRKATDYIEQVYGQSFYGERVTATQALSFPRSGVYVNGYLIANDVIPESLTRACAELALKAISETLSPDVGQQVKRKKVDVLEVEYADYSSSVKRYTAIDNLLAPLLASMPNSAFRKVVRV